MLLSGLSHRRQQAEADCLLACVAMILDSLAVPMDDQQLRRLLGTTEMGTPFPHIDRLRTRGLFVERGRGDLQSWRIT